MGRQMDEAEKINDYYFFNDETRFLKINYNRIEKKYTIKFLTEKIYKIDLWNAEVNYIDFRAAERFQKYGIKDNGIYIIRNSTLLKTLQQKIDKDIFDANDCFDICIKTSNAFIECITYEMPKII